MLRAYVYDSNTLESITLPEPLDPRTWKLHFKKDILEDERSVLSHFDVLKEAFNDKTDTTYIQFRMDNLGRHEYVSLAEVEERIQSNDFSGPLTVILEDAVKEQKMRLGNSVVIISATASFGPRAPQTDLSDSELCPPMGLYKNYTICDELSLGRTQHIMLSDESTLNRGIELNQIKIFNFLSLIVNCHETQRAMRPDKYSVGTANPEIIFEPIHQLIQRPPSQVAATYHRIETKVWEALQTGSVAVHCLAGVHRAPTVVVCQYLYRYYALGMHDVDINIQAIYKRLNAKRPGVEPLSYLSLIHHYHDFLKKTYGK